MHNKEKEWHARFLRGLREKSRGGGEESTIIHWLWDLQRLYARVVVLGFPRKKEKERSSFSLEEKSIYTWSICVHRGGWYCVILVIAWSAGADLL